MSDIKMPETLLRRSVRPADVRSISALLSETATFTSEEVALAAELVLERLRLGQESGYEFILLETSSAGGPEMLGYACHGRSPCTKSSWDLYWIAVSPQAQGTGLGRLLLQAVVQDVMARGGERLYAETSSLPRYEPARRFYCQAGFRHLALFPDFYAPGDAKLVYEKRLSLAEEKLPGAAGFQNS